MNLAAFRYTRIRKLSLGMLATVWLALALHPCAMAYGQYETPGAAPQHHCPHCPPPANNTDCALTDWQHNTHATSSISASGPDAGTPPLSIVTAIIALSLWQPVMTGSAPPPTHFLHSNLQLPLSRQDQLRL